ncbi:MAG: histidine phosphatase family protein [Brachymonas sp.]|nr:histidine phosphatase family protein [Brachymonas sp.]
MDLLLWRHAQAVDVNSTLDDLQRPLTPHGEAQAERMAAWLKRHLPAQTRILCSPALRTRQTVQHLTTKDYEICPHIAPNASVQDLLQAAQWPGDNAAAENQGVTAETVVDDQAQQALGKIEAEAETEAVAETAADKKTKNKRAVLIVGHQPTLGLVAQQLLQTQTPCAIKKGSLWWLRHRVRNSQPQVVLVAVLNPQML